MDAVAVPFLPGILVVEDEPSVRSFLRTALEPTTRVVEAHDGEQAVEILRDHARDTLDLVLADYRLPKRSGLEVLRVTRDTWPWIRVVLITAFGSEQLAVQAFREGASDYLTKPIALETLLQVVATLTSTRASRADTAAGHGLDMGSVDPRIRRALAFMDERFSSPLSLGEVARKAGLSRFHFCRIFHRDTGRLFHDYLQELRVRRAQVLLATHHLPITEVAYAVGFSDLSHFDRTFRRRVGRSPSQYRTALQEPAAPSSSPR